MLTQKTVVLVDGPDDFDVYLKEALQNPEFVKFFDWAQTRYEAAYPEPLSINGREYRRRLRARRRRGRR